MTTFVPYFIPIVSPGGGGGGGKKEFFQALGMYSLVLGLYVGLIYYDTCPTYKMKVFYNSDRDRIWSLGPGYNVAISLKYGYTTEERVKHNNIDCLRQKGYNVKIYEPPSYTHYYDHNRARIESEESIEQILKDCKECDVHTEITYRFNDIFRNERTSKTSFRWHKYYQEELK